MTCSSLLRRGLVSVTGTPETATKTGILCADIAAGLYASQAVLAAIFRRERNSVSRGELRSQPAHHRHAPTASSSA